jgi:hypothetical protein
VLLFIRYQVKTLTIYPIIKWFRPMPAILSRELIRVFHPAAPPSSISGTWMVGCDETVSCKNEWK